MMLRTLVGGLLLASLVAPACAQDEEETPVHDFSVTLTAATDYVFRGAAKAAKLVDPPVGYRDL